MSLEDIGLILFIVYIILPLGLSVVGVIGMLFNLVIDVYTGIDIIRDYIRPFFDKEDKG